MKLILRKGRYYLQIKKQLYSLHTKEKNLAEQIFCEMIKHHVLRKISIANRRNRQCDGMMIIDPPKKISIVEPMNEYIRTACLKGLSKGKIRAKIRIKKLLLDCNILYFSDFNQENINHFIEKLSNLSEDSKKTYITQLRAFMNYSIKKQFMTDRQFKGIEFPNIKSRPRELIICDDDLEILFNASAWDEDFHIYLLTLYNTVTRPNEAATLKLSDFDFENRKVTIYMSKVKRYKTVYITKKFADMIAEYAARRRRTEYLFRGAGSSEYYAKKFKRLKERLAMPQAYTLYIVRHTAITNLMNKCHDVEFVARQAGNDPKTTMKHYVNRADKHYLDILDNM